MRPFDDRLSVMFLTTCSRLINDHQCAKITFSVLAHWLQSRALGFSTWMFLFPVNDHCAVREFIPDNF